LLLRYKAAANPTEQETAMNDIRSELMSEIIRLELFVEYRSQHPNTEVVRDVDVYVEQAETLAEFQTKYPGRKGWTIIDNKPWVKISDIDLLVLDRTLPKAKILHREELKTGQLDTPGKAASQIKNAHDAIVQSLNGGPAVKLRQGHSPPNDLTASIDLSSIGASTSAHRGPLGSKAFDKTTGISFAELQKMLSSLVKASQGGT
jgi:hypothetical protein